MITGMIMQRPVLTLAMLLAAAPCVADPAIGTALQVGQSLGGAAEARLGSTVYVLHPIGRWLVGGELAGSIEGYYDGWAVVPSGALLLAQRDVQCPASSCRDQAGCGDHQPSAHSRNLAEARCRRCS